MRVVDSLSWPMPSLMTLMGTPISRAADAQLWQFIGTQDNMKMKCKTGRYVNYANGRFTASTTGIALKLVASTNSSATDYWEIQRQGSSNSMNQWGGAGSGDERFAHHQTYVRGRHEQPAVVHRHEHQVARI